MVYDYVIFDFDGTLADDTDLLISKIAEVAKKEFNIQPTPELIQELRGLSASEIVKKLRIPLHKVPTLAIEVQKYMKSSISKIPLKEGMREVLKRLATTHKLGILSSNSHDNIKAFLIKEGLLGDFEFIEECSKILGKSHCMKAVIKKIKTDNIIYVGDELRDVEAMQSISIPIISVTWGMNSRESLVNANAGRVVDHPAQLLQII